MEVDLILARLAEVKARGYAISDGENAYGLRTVSAAILDTDGSPIAGVSLTIHAERMPMEQFASRAIPEVRRIAQELTTPMRNPSAPCGSRAKRRFFPAQRYETNMKPLTKNLFKARLGKQQQIGFFATLGTPSLTELLSGCGFDWALIDTEHSPIETPDVIDHLRAIEGAGIPALVRPAWNDMVLIKRILDQGAQTC